jgi:O-antigen/teichoic acid export membrane protein
MRNIHSWRSRDQHPGILGDADQPGGVNFDFQIPILSSAPEGTRSARNRAARLISIFFLGQGALQGVQILAGLLLVRWLSIEAWAQYGLASGLQLTMTALMDLGISSTIIPLVGNRRDNRHLVGRYVRSAKHLRDRTFWILAPFTALAFLSITYHHHWGWHVQFLLLVSVLVSLYSSGHVSCFSPPYFLFGRLRDFYTPQTLSAVIRLIAYAVCRVGGVLNAWVAAGLYALSTTVNGVLLEKGSHRYLEWPEQHDASTDREVLHYILPAMPAIVFSAFQAQISLFLITIFGNTANIAQVAALSKLGQLFSVLMTFNVVVVEPYIARLSRARLLSTYSGFASLGVCFCMLVTFVAFVFPRPFLWLLGPNYEGLQNLVGWVVLAACLNYVAGLMWIMNRARKWIFWSGTWVEIFLLLGVQIAFILLIGVRTTREAVLFTLASSFCYIATHAYVAVAGFRRGPRQDAG